MPSFMKLVESEFGSADLYEVLGVDKKAMDGEIRRAYHRLSLKVHPDRVEPEEVEKATQKFQVLGKIYSVLHDKDKRAIYDEYGTVDEEDELLVNQNWAEYWRQLFQKVTITDIKAFEKTYKGSDEEKDTLKSVYVEKKGNMDEILNEVLCATLEDEPRFRKLIEEWIANEEVPPFPAFTRETKTKKRLRKRKFEEEAKEAEVLLKEMGTHTKGESLSALIKGKQKSRDGGFLNSLEEKYCAKKPRLSSKKKTPSSAQAGSSKGTKGGRRKGKRS